MGGEAGDLLAWPAGTMDDDDFDFSDADLDDLPANTLLQLETTAIRATQQQQSRLSSAPAPDHDAAYYGFDDADEDEVVNLDDRRAAPLRPTDSATAYQPSQADHGASVQCDGAMDVEALPRQSQVDVGRLLERIKKVRLNKALAAGLVANGCS